MLSSAKPGHRSLTGNPDTFDLVSAAQFQLLTALGLREFHFVLEIGCGALGVARLLIPYLLAGRYFGLERDQWLLEEGVRLELGHDQLELKQPSFLTFPDYRASDFKVKFDYAIASAMLSLSSPQLRTCLEECARSLRKNGVLIASSENPGTLIQTAAEAGLSWKLVDWPHPTEEMWLLFYLAASDSPPELSSRFQSCTVENLAELQVIHNVTCGFTESFVDDGRSLLITGWAIHPESHRNATHVLVADSLGRIVAKARVGLSRSDVAAAYGHQALRSGFHLWMEKQANKDLSSLSFVSLTEEKGKAFVLSSSIST